MKEDCFMLSKIISKVQIIFIIFTAFIIIGCSIDPGIDAVNIIKIICTLLIILLSIKQSSFIYLIIL